MSRKKSLRERIASNIPLYGELIRIRKTLKSIHHELGMMRTMEAIRCYDFEIESNPRYQDLKRLQRYALQVNSQNGEDGIIHEIFRRVETSDRVFAEVGVGDGTENNTAFLLSQGWNGFWIDGSDAFLRTIKACDDLQSGCLKSSVSHVKRDNVAELFERLGVPKDLDLLSLDIDHNTFYIWEALHDFTPRVVVVEYNAAILPDVDWRAKYAEDRTWDGTQNFGASLKAFEKLGTQLGYSLVGCDFNGVNAFFVRADVVKDKFAEPFTAENHYEPPRYAYIHQRTHPRTILDRCTIEDRNS